MPGWDRRVAIRFRASIVRAVEILQAFDEALAIIDGYEPPDRPAVEVEPRRAVGHGATEAPRGMLYHRYEIDDDGTILEREHRSADFAEPVRSIEEDLRAVVERNIELPDEALRVRCEQAIRNHDPCISCATHFLELTVDRR